MSRHSHAKEHSSNKTKKVSKSMFDGLKAYLVWDGDDTVRIPDQMGAPKSGQMEGLVAERLTELAGRVCYDSLGSGRSSADYFDHILGVGHLSIAEHFQSTILLRGSASLLFDLAPVLFNRPGVWVSPLSNRELYLTLNPRTAFEWNKWSAHLSASIGAAFNECTSSSLGVVLRRLMHSVAPRIVKNPSDEEHAGAQKWLRLGSAEIVPPRTDDEKWITAYVVGSRGLSHELVRHGDFTAISQRSTRYCEESESPWIIHPLIQTYVREGGGDASDKAAIEELVATARIEYSTWVTRLQTWLVGRGVDKISARKQARGAARGFLGNALETEVIFSASVSQWRHMMRMRASNAADAEIRCVFSQLLPVLKASRYGDRFADLDLAPASDGIGTGLVDGGAK